jgi:microcystin-dependent protein
MPAISKAFVTIADGAVDPASPLDTVLMTGIRDSLVHLREWVGASYYAGAVQDHDHDGTNSKAISGQIASVRWWPGHSLPSVAEDWCDGGTLSRVTYPAAFAALVKEGTITISLTSPAIVTWIGHGLRSNLPARLFTTGALPTGFTAGTNGGAGVGTEYFVEVINTDTFWLRTLPLGGGARVNATGSQSGVHTLVCAPHGNGDGSTTFHKPDMRGRGPIGRDDMGGTAANRVTSSGSGIQALVPGRSGGAETVTLTTTEMPVHAHSGSVALPQTSGKGAQITGVGGGTDGATRALTLSINNNGSGGAHQNMKPSIVGDWIIRIL